MALQGTDPVHKVSIIPRGVGALGYTIQRPTEDRFLMTREELENKMAVLLGGRAAEEIVFGRLSTGAADDLVKVANIARSMVTRYGMVESLGHLAYEEEQAVFLAGPLLQKKREFSEETAREIDLEVRKIVEDAIIEVRTILQDRRSALDALAKLLMEKETIDGKELREILDAHYPGPKLVPASTAITSMERPLEEQSDDERESRSV
jgi:cell division protease FtsH